MQKKKLYEVILHKHQHNLYKYNSVNWKLRLLLQRKINGKKLFCLMINVCMLHHTAMINKLIPEIITNVAS